MRLIRSEYPGIKPKHHRSTKEDRDAKAEDDDPSPHGDRPFDWTRDVGGPGSREDAKSNKARFHSHYQSLGDPNDPQWEFTVTPEWVPFWPVYWRILAGLALGLASAVRLWRPPSNGRMRARFTPHSCPRGARQAQGRRFQAASVCPPRTGAFAAVSFGPWKPDHRRERRSRFAFLERAGAELSSSNSHLQDFTR